MTEEPEFKINIEEIREKISKYSDEMFERFEPISQKIVDEYKHLPSKEMLICKGIATVELFSKFLAGQISSIIVMSGIRSEPSLVDYANYFLSSYVNENLSRVAHLNQTKEND